jgi:hypothetical protein
MQRFQEQVIRSGPKTERLMQPEDHPNTTRKDHDGV